jgi:anti-sigma regulatory factor (Ser/Thr protein kinase)
VTGRGSEQAWPSATPPAAADGVSWSLADVAELPRVRAEARRHAAATALANDPRSEDLRDQLVLALDEMASNALRHGGGSRVSASVRLTAEAYLIEVSDEAASSPPVPAVDRDPSEGGLGLYLIAELATAHGWYSHGSHKFVWALLPRG